MKKFKIEITASFDDEGVHLNIDIDAGALVFDAIRAIEAARNTLKNAAIKAANENEVGPWIEGKTFEDLNQKAS